MFVRAFPFALLLLSVTACESETERNQATLIGHWQLTKGLRNFGESSVFQGVYYEFGANGKMQTNLPIGAETPTDYTVSKAEIEQKSAEPVRYKIQSLNDSVLVLQFEMRGVPFELRFRRSNEAPGGVPPSNHPSDSIDR